MHENEQYVEEALRAGASGYIVKKAADRDLVETCRATLRGEPFRYQGPDTTLIGGAVRRARQGERPRQPLTPRETEIIKLVAESYTNKQIAAALVISEKTVDRHRANILREAGPARPRSADALRDPQRPHGGVTGGGRAHAGTIR